MTPNKGPDWPKRKFETECPICGVVFKTKSTMKRHKKLAHYDRDSPLARPRSGYHAKHIETGMHGGGEQELELILTMDEYRKVNEVLHIPACELIEIFIYLGYRRVENKAEKLADVGTDRP